MRKLIHSDFQIDLSDFQLSDNEENNWFSDSFFTKYSFPFEMDLDKNMDIVTGFISQLNSSSIKTFFNVKYVYANKIEDAILEIESYQNKLNCVLRYGFEQLPSFDKKLSELSLQKFDLPDGISIYDHANSVISKTWPEVNYNFPQVHTDMFDPEDALWNGFEKIINNRKNGVFLKNEIDTVENVSVNRNIIQPFPYWLHVLQRGMIDSGYNLTGDILTDTRIQKATLFNTSKYYKEVKIQESQINVPVTKPKTTSISYDTDGSEITMGHYEYIFTISSPAKYLLIGSITTVMGTLFGGPSGPDFPSAKIYIDEIEKWSTPIPIEALFTYDIELEFEVTTTRTIKIIANSRIKPLKGLLEDEYSVFDLVVSPIYEFDNQGKAIPTIENENKIDLTKSTCNITFGEFIKVIKNWFNYDLTVEGKNAIMNRVESKINYNNAINLKETEVKFPLKKFQQGISFLLKFQDIESTKFKYLPVFQNINEVLTENFKIDEKTSTIEINALPLPLYSRSGINTAYSFEDNDSKVYLLAYNGIFNNNNLALPETEYLIPTVHEKDWYKWFQFRINSIGYLWNFKKWIEDIYELHSKSKIFAYNKFHIIKTINKTEVKPDLFDIEIETETLE